MVTAALERVSEVVWRAEPTGEAPVPVVVYADEALLREMDDKVLEQAGHVAALPGIVRASFVLPDGHWGYGFPIGGVAAFDAQRGGVVSAGGVGFDISCGVRCLRTGIRADDLAPFQVPLAEALLRSIPAGVGSRGTLHLRDDQMDAMLVGGAGWAVASGFGERADLDRIEERGTALGADPALVSPQARSRQRDEMGTLGSGNHYLEVQRIDAVLDGEAAAAMGLVEGETVVSIHCGSRGLGHQVGTDYLKEMAEALAEHELQLPDRELACAPLGSDLARRYLGAMRAATNCALANRQILAHLTREVFGRFFPGAVLPTLYDVSHNTCKEEMHETPDGRRVLFVHRKGATRALGPGSSHLPSALRDVGQPVFIGGSMGTESWILAGSCQNSDLPFGSACHGAGRRMSRHQAARTWRSSRVLEDELKHRGIVVRSRSWRGLVEEAPGAYKDAAAVVAVAERAGLARRVARLRPMVCVKG
jgi:tRNA-splicing ligase RtcB